MTAKQDSGSPQEDGCAALVLGKATGAQPATPFDSESIEKFVKKYWNQLRARFAEEEATKWFMQSDLPHHRLTRTELYRLNAVDYARKALVALHYVEQLQQYNGTYSALQKELRIVLRDASYRAKMAYRNAR